MTSAAAPAYTVPRRRRWAREAGLLLLCALSAPLCATSRPDAPRFVIAPYLQAVGPTGLTVLFECDRPMRATVTVSAPGEAPRVERSAGAGRFHSLRVEGLAPRRAHVYAVRCEADGLPDLMAPEREVVTAPEGAAPCFFAVVADSQDYPDTWGTIARRVHEERPEFVVHCGDLVGRGYDKEEWVEGFFGPARDLFGHAPFFSVLGNHEEDAGLWYDFVAHPEPEHRYTFAWGDARFFLIDSNRDTAEGSEQHRWLEAALGARTERWCFVVLHHPPRTSDADDYRDPVTGERAPGDPRVHALGPLLERHGVDFVLFGHIHAYERSHPLRAGAVDREAGVTYLQCGGAGGRLEASARARSPLTAALRRCHHYCTCSVDGPRLEWRAYDENGALFDRFERVKREARQASIGRPSAR
jgi:predicted phosphodiesterase